MEPRDRLMARVIGQRQELSFYDVKLANKAYCDGMWQWLNYVYHYVCIYSKYIYVFLGIFLSCYYNFLLAHAN